MIGDEQSRSKVVASLAGNLVQGVPAEERDEMGFNRGFETVNRIRPNEARLSQCALSGEPALGILSERLSGQSRTEPFGQRCGSAHHGRAGMTNAAWQTPIAIVLIHERLSRHSLATA